MRKAIIDSAGLVVNIVTLPDDWTGAAGEWQVPAAHSAMDPLNAGPGDTWDGTQFVKPTRDPGDVREEQYRAANTEYVKRGLALLGVKVRGSDPAAALTAAAVKETHRGGPNASPLAALHDKLDILKDAIEVSADPASIDVTDGMHWV